MRKLLCLLLLVIGSAWCLFGQAAPVSQVSGIVQDQSGLPIPNVRVTITNTDTGSTRTVTNGADGLYTFTSLPVGRYKLEATADGFSTYSQSGIVLQVASNPLINITMKVGAIAEVIEVQADTVMVETQSSGVGQVIDNQRVVDLPLNGRNVGQLIALSGAAVAYPQGQGMQSNLNHPDTVAYSVGGGTGNATNYNLDGGTHIDPRTNIGLPLPFPDAMQEFKVETSSLPANYGSQPGGAVNVVTKSGTNELHGNAFWFLRNGRMNARNFFAPTRDSLKRNQFGGTLGGPIIKNKLFFFGAFQQTYERTAPTTRVAFVPTAEMMAGDFRTFLGPECRSRPITLNSKYAQNNVIYPGALDRTALNFFSRVQTATDPCGRIQYGVPTPRDAYQIVGKVDWERSATARSFVRYYLNDNELTPYLDPDNILAAALGLLNRTQSVIVGDTWVISPTLVNSLRLNYNRSAVQRVNAEGTPTWGDFGANIHIGFPNYTGMIFNTGNFNYIFIPGYVYSNIYGLSDDVSWTTGSHQLSFGFTYIRTEMNALGPFQMNPQIFFTGQQTGNSMADFLTGRVTTFNQGGGQVGREVQNSPALYFQDNWKVTPRFQVNMGLRWDPFLPQYSRYGYATRFSRERFDAGQRSTFFVNAPAGVYFPGDPGFDNKSNTTPNWANFAPRLGIVFDPRGQGKETIRAGYGLFYNGSSYLWHTMHIPLNPPWGQTVSLTAPEGGLSNPWLNFPGGNPFPSPTSFPSDFRFVNSGKYVFESDDGASTYMQQWNLSIQKQLAANLLVTATYMGNRTLHLWLSRSLNPAQYIPGEECTLGGVTYKPCSSSGNTHARRLFTLADPVNGPLMGNVYQVDDGASASYNGMILALNKRFSNNFSALANYTWSHCLNEGEPDQDITNFYQDPNNRAAEWGNCSLDRRHLFNASVVAQSPALGSGVVRAITSDWGWSGIFTYQSGSNLTVTTGQDKSLTANGDDRPNIVGNPVSSSPTIDRWFNTDAFEFNPIGQFGNAGRSVGLYGPSAWNVDMALWRSFPVQESLRIDFRIEAFNVLNHARFDNPNTSFASNTFGKITTAQDPRILQLALKVVF